VRRPHLRHDHRAAGVAAGAALAALALPPGAAGTVGIFLPQPTAQLTTEPPLLSRGQVLERRFPGRLASRLRVAVDLDREGRPVGVQAVQRLTISTLGDYFFVVPAPVISVSAAPESAVTPGQRRQGIVWQGFSPGRRVLGASLRLRTAAVAPFLPLRVRIVPGGVRISNATAVPVLAYAARVPRSVVAPIVRDLRTSFERGRLPYSATVPASTTPPTVRMRAEAVFDVRGTLVFRRRRVPFAGRIGPGAKRALVVSARSRERPAVRLVATPSLPVELVRVDRARRSGAALLRLAYRAYFSVARGQQYARFLTNPDPGGTATASFVYRTAPKAAAAAVASPSSDDGTSALVIGLLVAGTVVVLSGLVVVWAHL
jgi:hypothetical protein